ncbi:NAD(P)-binding protein [Pholiota conissans]|uniref:NAD(P)-binding protein n=1 Tax=Pholiota conissans TaxID=109636 RepID=A0A9P6CVW6_9AGAR|nr:NAD(P)-binding protein [Pholiota conissans]
MSESKLIFVTGASGFLASHIIYQLLQQGHRVRATARGKKVAALKELYGAYPSIEIIEVPDIATSQFGDAFAGVDAVIHTAAPLPARVEVETLLQTATEGSLNVLCQAEAAGVRKFVVTSSTAAVVRDPATKGVTYRPEHWNPMTKEEISADDPVEAYAGAKKFSELAVWEWANAHPHVDVTTINPSYLYGPPSALTLPIAPGDFTSLSTNLTIYNLFTSPGGHLPGFGFTDFRDTARAHVGAALDLGVAGLDNDTAKQQQQQQLTPTEELWQKKRKRVIVVSPHGLVERDILDVIRKERPQIAERLIAPPEPGSEPKFDRYDADFARVAEVTGLRKEDFHTTEQTFLDTIDSLLAVEKAWQEQGFVLEEVPIMQI